MVINFVCRASKAKRDGLSPLELSIIINGKRKYITLDRNVKAANFDSKKQKVMRDAATNEYMAVIKAKCFSIETEMLKNGMEITLDTFIEVYKNGFKSNTITLLQLFKEHNEQLTKKIAKGIIADTTLDKYVVTIGYIKNFLKKTYKKDDIMVKDITPMFVEDFFVFLLESMSNNTAIQKMKQLKKILRIAVEEGHIKVSPFKTTLKKEKKEVEPLTIEEVRKIRNKKITIERIAKIRDLFIFQCYTGLAYADMASLTAKDFVSDDKGNKWIVKNRHKTKVLSRIPLLPMAEEILTKYDGKLPILTNIKFNAYLKELGDICGIKKSLHTHLARHTFATILLNSGVDMVSVSKILGHANSRITEKVYAKMLPDTIMKKVKGVQANLI